MSNPMQTVVWGCERPKLLITETLAWHDRRTEDLAASTTPAGATTPSGKYTTAGGSDPGTTNGGPDLDFDQRLVPMPAAFIELYNPWNTPVLDHDQRQ